MMNYDDLADELINLKATIPHVEAEHRLSRMIKGEVFVLNYIYAKEGESYPKDISKSMMVSTARIARILRTLEKKGFITRTVDVSDNRKVVLGLTEEGRRIVALHRKELKNSVKNMLEKLGEEDAKAYVRIQKKLATIIFED